MGMTPQTGLPQSARVGDFDLFALLKLHAAGFTTDRVLETLGQRGGLLGISGISADLRDIEQAAAGGDERAALAIEVFVESLRHYLGAYLAAINGADAIVFTGGIGQHSAAVRAAAIEEMDYARIVLDEAKNAAADGDAETRIDAAESRTQIWVMPTDEEQIVARQAAQVLAMREA
jgi:acetate kinase